MLFQNKNYIFFSIREETKCKTRNDKRKNLGKRTRLFYIWSGNEMDMSYRVSADTAPNRIIVDDMYYYPEKSPRNDRSARYR